MSLGSLTVAGTAISTWTRHARLLKYGSGSKRGSNLVIPHADGEYAPAVKYFTATDLLLEVALLRSPNTALQYLSGLLEALSSMSGLVQLKGTSTFHGTLQTDVELLGEPQLAGVDDPSVYVLQLRCPAGVWEDETQQTDTGNPPTGVVVDGDRPVSDPIIEFSGPGYIEHTDAAGIVSRVTIDAGAGAGTYTVDCGLPRSVTKAGAAQDAYLTVTQPWWMRLEAGKTASFTSDVSVTVKWRDKWAV